MGHDVAAALLATRVVGPLRRARRAGAGLEEQARQADQPCASMDLEATSPVSCCGSACSTVRHTSSTPGTPGRCGCGTGRWSRSCPAGRPGPRPSGARA
ncbi:hypothetical protein [Streptomyces rishiriensis]|uniref:hypothetical protein n=1 Tax=Streptomyces rishiriensis TaxID=68264 RepID=UPI0037D3B3C1